MYKRQEVEDAEVVEESTFDLADWGDRIEQCIKAEDPAIGIDMLRLLHLSLIHI